MKAKLMNTLEKLKEFTFKGQRIPGYMHAAIALYIDRGVIPGDFLQSVICNDLKSACFYADDENMWLFSVYIAFFYNEAPAPCWGNKKKMQEWHNERYVTVSKENIHE